MHRVDSPGAAPGGYFQSANPATGTARTLFTPDWFNDLQENVCQFITGAGVPLIKGDPTSLTAAVRFVAYYFAGIAQTAAVEAAAADATTKVNAALLAAAADATTRANAALAAAKAYSWSPGDLKSRAVSTVEPGWYECDGSMKTVAGDPALFAALGGFYGGDGVTTFAVPDYRGRFQRVWDHGAGIDLGRGLGTVQGDAFQGHIFDLPGMPKIGSGSSYAGSGAGVQVGVSVTETGGPKDDGVHGAPRVADETRPKNVSVMVVIKR